MKKTILFVLSLGVIGVFVCFFLVSSGLGSEAKVFVFPLHHDFGEIWQGQGKVRTIVNIKNSGGKPLKIHRLSTSCGCTTAEMDQSDLLPGQKRKMVITFDPMTHPNQLGKIKRVVYLQTSDPNQSEVEIDIEGVVLK